MNTMEKRICPIFQSRVCVFVERDRESVCESESVRESVGESERESERNSKRKRVLTRECNSVAKTKERESRRRGERCDYQAGCV